MRAVIFSVDDKYILTGSNDGTVKGYDFSTRQEIFVFENEAHHKNPSSPFKSIKAVRELALSHDNKYFIIGSDDDSVKIVHLESKEVLHSFPEAHTCISKTLFI